MLFRGPPLVSGIDRARNFTTVATHHAQCTVNKIKDSSQFDFDPFRT